MTTTTGMASLQFEHSQTIHSWSGIGDSHLARNKVIQNIIQSNSWLNIREKIINTDLLIIDEIGMMSAKIFEDIEYICRAVRRECKPFGGIQVVGSGSFRQLAPIPSSNDPGQYCFESDIFGKVFPYVVHLMKVSQSLQIEPI